MQSKDIMKILYDHEIFTRQDYGGISRYFSELMDKFSIDKNMFVKFPIFFSNNQYLRGKDFVAPVNFLSHQNSWIKKRGIKLLNYINEKKIVTALKIQDFDIFHPTYYTPYYHLDVVTKPMVITIHDMIHEFFPGMFSGSNAVLENKKTLAEKASKIIAVSETTKKDILDFYGINEDKISVVHHGPSFRADPNFYSRPPKIDLPGKYLLYVGKRKSYKNFPFFLKSVGPLLKDSNGLHVVCAGGGNFDENELIQFKELGIERKIIHFSFQNDSVLMEIYRNALAFVFPSLYEGFGIPILEAFFCECPVILSDIPAFREVAGEAGIYFSPTNEESLRWSIQRLKENERLICQLKEKGIAQLKNFSWEKTAAETKSVYRKVLGKEYNLSGSP
jgi:glycosyltransferase involved in cell wall biosynthesis